MYERVIKEIRSLFHEPSAHIPLHRPYFIGNEHRYTADTIDSTFVSSVGEYVGRAERMLAAVTGAKYAVALANGTSALHLALYLQGVTARDLVITQPFTFVATCNAIRYLGADPLFVDIENKALGISPEALEDYLKKNTKVESNNSCFELTSGRRITACVPMHTFGMASRIHEIVGICAKYGIAVVEDAAEALGTLYQGKHVGLWGACGVLSFNGNKIVTSGGGGALITDDEQLAKRAKHLSTQAKLIHPWNFSHDETGFNYRMPNINAALLCAQLESLDLFLKNKRELANAYNRFFREIGIPHFMESLDTRSNYWLNAVLMDSLASRERFLEESNKAGVMTRPAWTLMHRLPMYQDCLRGPVPVSEDIADRLVNIPSSYRP